MSCTEDHEDGTMPLADLDWHTKAETVEVIELLAPPRATGVRLTDPPTWEFEDGDPDS